MASLRRIGRRMRQFGPLALAAAVYAAMLDGRYASLEELTLWSSLLLASLALVASILWVALIQRRVREAESPVPAELEVGAQLFDGAFAVVDTYVISDTPIY